MIKADLIAQVYAVPHDQRRAWKAIKTSSRYVAPAYSEEEDEVEYGRHDRAVTEPPEESNGPAHLNMPHLEVKFSDIPRTTHGIIFGCDPNSDVILPNIKGISKHHFSLTFDDENRLIIRDWGSLLGTEVTYDAQGHGRRSNFRWIVGGDPNPEDKACIIIKIHDTVEFRLVAARHDVKSTEYMDKVHSFRQGTATAEDLFRDLDLPQRPDTELPTGAHTPGRGEIHLRKKIGEGTYGVVTHFWNVSDGSEYALKEPTAKAIRKRVVTHEAWGKEARIMSEISHPHIVRLFKADYTPHPRLFLEYAPSGSLDDHEFITANETISILQQCLSALTYLHERKPPIVHRDIKPGNILVRHRLPGDIHVVFGDFGMARDSYELSTICGTYLYLAPEVYLEWQSMCSNAKIRKRYTPAVDIWSLGVVAYELICRLPRYENSYRDGGTVWCDKIVEAFLEDVTRRPDALGHFLLNNMVVISPESRSSARECYEEAVLLPSAAESSSNTPRPAPSTGAEEHTAFRNGPEGLDADNRRTADRLPIAYADHYTATSYDGEFVRSEAPPPETVSPVSKERQEKTAISEAVSLQFPSSVRRSRRTIQRRDRRNHRRNSVSNAHLELAHFLEDYSSDPFNSLYVGSSLASWVGEGTSGSGAGQSSDISTIQHQLEYTDAQTDRGPGLIPPPNMTSIPRSPWQGCCVEDKEPATESSGGVQADESYMAALLLQDIGRSFRQ